MVIKSETSHSVISRRMGGKTTLLLFGAIEYARLNPDEKVLFVSPVKQEYLRDLLKSYGKDALPFNLTLRTPAAARGVTGDVRGTFPGEHIIIVADY